MIPIHLHHGMKLLVGIAKVSEYLTKLHSGGREDMPNCLFASKIYFGEDNTRAVHQVIDLESLQDDVDNALYNAERDGFDKIVFYI